MQRRELLRMLASGAALQLAPTKLTVVMREVRALLATTASPRTLNAHQDATVKAMAELILPRTDTPGATDVGTSQFIDFILTEWSDERERQVFLAGLADVDVRTRALFDKDFIDCSTPQQSEILINLGEAMLQDTERSPRRRGRSVDSQPNFYSMFRRLTLTAYYTSEAGATQELHFEMIPDRYDGCVPASEKKAQARQ